MAPDLKRLVIHSSILYAPKPFKWMSTAHSAPLGHVLATEGLEVPVTEDLADGTKISYEAAKLKIYPMVWTNPKTGELSLQVHGQAAWKLYLKDGPEGMVKVVDDLKEVREFMDRIMRPAITPSNIYAHKHEEGDVVLWYNRALWHSIVSWSNSVVYLKLS
jgi:alpha-ketoglutarate-dependent taurine dioxygenase